jgi:hypothetical protein
MRPSGHAAVALLAVVCLLASCSADTPTVQSPAGSTTGSAAASASSLKVKGCPGISHVRCGSILVPRYWSRPPDPSTDLKVLVNDLAVSGRAVWNRDTYRMTATLVLTGADSGRITIRFPTQRPGGPAIVAGVVDGRAVRLRMPAPWSAS